MHLEQVCHEPPACSRPVPVMFVHGAWHGAWCWAERFLPYFARHGYAAYAFDLRGHGNSDRGRRLNRTRIADYVADLDQVVRGLDATPVVVGHSMGGVIVQKYLETRRAAAGVLMAPLPPSGGLPASARQTTPRAGPDTDAGVDPALVNQLVAQARERLAIRWKAALNAFETTFDGRLRTGRK